MDAGAFIGYRRLSSGSGSWIARLRDSAGKQHYEALGSADDTLAADGETVLTFGQAQDQARAFFARKRRELAGHIEGRSGPLTVAVAVEVYLAHRRRRGSKAVAADVKQADARIVPALGAVEVERLTSSGSMRGCTIWRTRPASCARAGWRRLRPRVISTAKTAKRSAVVDQPPTGS